MFSSNGEKFISLSQLDVNISANEEVLQDSNFPYFCLKSGGYFYFHELESYNPDQDQLSSKLRISVGLTDVEKAAEIVSKILNKHDNLFKSYKITDVFKDIELIKSVNERLALLSDSEKNTFDAICKEAQDGEVKTYDLPNGMNSLISDYLYINSREFKRLMNGGQFTFYVYEPYDEKNISDFIKEIDGVFQKEKISPGIKPESDRALTSYFSGRVDYISGKYASSEIFSDRFLSAISKKDEFLNIIATYMASSSEQKFSGSSMFFEKDIKKNTGLSFMDLADSLSISSRYVFVDMLSNYFLCKKTRDCFSFLASSGGDVSLIRVDLSVKVELTEKAWMLLQEKLVGPENPFAKFDVVCLFLHEKNIDSHQKLLALYKNEESRLMKLKANKSISYDEFENIIGALSQLSVEIDSLKFHIKYFHLDGYKNLLNGSQFQFFVSDSSDVKLIAEFLSEIENILISSDIAPGIAPKKNSEVSSYFSVRTIDAKGAAIAFAAELKTALDSREQDVALTSFKRKID